jgi:hypothetical protein
MRNPEMEAGECRWMGREDMHVYCMGSRVDGKYDARERVYKLWTKGCQGSPWDKNGWTSWSMVGQQIDALLKADARPAKRKAAK